MSTTPTPEFSRTYKADQIVRLPETLNIVADEAERAALTKRFGLVSIDRLEADYALSIEDEAIVARGRVRAAIAQPCVATGAPVPETIDSDFLLRFVVEGDEAPEGEELELDAEDCDIIGYDGHVIDMGEAVAETMALAMTPFPRSPDADAYLKEAGVLSEEQASPFAALLGLKDGKK
ncbi:YceD family protein [Sphingobium sp.]|uniref:YceD family protein n=1 Tax=Sphingobium sp. TaxID=1912891 RepID=UPI003B3A6842